MVDKNPMAKHLLKEYARRLALYHHNMGEIHPGPGPLKKLPSKNPTKEELLRALNSDALRPDAREDPILWQCWLKFKGDIHDHYYANARTTDATFREGLRKVECMLHKNTRDAFTVYKSQLTREELDANRIHQLELTWYRKSAELYNSEEVLESRLLDFEYGCPFNKKYRLVCPQKKADASDFRDMSTSLRRPFITISKNCKASGKGFEHYVKKYTKKAHKDDNGNIISNSDVVGYGYAAFEEEGVLELMMQVMPDKYAGSMKGVPDLPLDGDDGNQKKRSSKKGGWHSTSKKRKDSVATSPSSGAVGAAGAAMKVLEYLKTADATEKLARKEEQLSRDKNYTISLEEHIQRSISHLFDLEMRFERQHKSPEEYKQHPYYKTALNDIEKAKAKLQVQEEKVKELEKEIEELKAAETSEVSRELFSATDSALKTPAESKSLAKFRYEHAGEFAATANDGSDDELDADYQINSGDDGENDDESNKGNDGESDD
jgi:hypothetical protein